MAPGTIENDFVDSGIATSPQKTLRPTLYSDVDQDLLQEKTSKFLLNYGAKFFRDVICGSKGIYVYTANGRKVLDWTSGQMSCLLGHGHPEIVQTIADHAANLDHLYSEMVSPPVISLGERLCSLLPPGLDKAFFLSTGGESNEAAIKLAKVYTGKFEVVGVNGSWHGLTAQAQSVQYHFARKGQGPLMPGMHMLPAPNAYRSIFRKADGSYDWETELDYGWSMIDQASCGSLAAVIVECIQSAAGMHVLPAGYLAALKRHCERRGMLLIVDEAQTGVGRAGDMMAIMHERVTPDILTLSKTLGNGLPLSAVVTSAEVERVCAERDYFFYTTHVNDPLPASVGNKVLEIVVRDDLVQHSRAMGLVLQDGLKRLQARYGCIGDVRGRGLMAGVEIVEDRETKVLASGLAGAVAEKAYELGVWANLSGHKSLSGVFRIAPPITVTKEELHEGLELFERAFASTPGTMPLY
ncbi:pyridoxal phosphate-dependent transferase [Jackrogersella minutella]|nr:pyridoxal phosphate-dependent transferase [Jackrogersella minutella]